MPVIGTGQMTVTDLNDVIASPIAPNNPIDGALWWNTTENKLYIYSNGQWVFSSDGMVFGGVNLLRNSTFGATTNGTQLKNWSVSATTSLVTQNDFLGSSSFKLTRTNWATGQTRHQLSQRATLIPFQQQGYQYTVSAWIYVDSSVPLNSGASQASNEISARIYKATDNSNRDYRIADLSRLEKDKWVYVKNTFTLAEDIQRLDVMFSIVENGLVKIARPQLETGNIASNWSPAPEDTEETISEIEKTLNNLADDSILDYNERQIIKDKLTDITGMVIPNANTAMPDKGYLDSDTNSAKGLFYNVRKQARQMAIATTDPRYVAVETTYEALRTYLGAMTPKPWNVDPATKNQIITVANKDTFRTTWLNLYNAINDLATYTVEKAKEANDNTGAIANGGINYISNGDFRLDISKSLWKSNYYGDVKEVVDISAEAPPHQFAFHVKNNSAKNGGIFVPVIWDANIAEAMVNRDVTISFWLKYKGITQGAQSYMAGRFGELVIEGLKADGQPSSTRYVRFQNATTLSENGYILGTNETWTKYSATIKIALPTDAVKIKRISFKHGIESCIGEFWTTGVKLEIGNKETPWSESPVDLYDRIGKAEFAVKPEEIVATVRGSSQYKTDIDTTKKYAQDEAKAQLDKIMGMKNLLIDSNRDYSTTSYLINQYTLTEDFVAGQKYTFVVKGTVPTGQKFGIWQNGGSSVVGYANPYDANNKDTFYTGVYFITFTALATTAGNERKLALYNYPNNATAGTVDWVALYKGEKPLDWMPSPEDIYSDTYTGKNLILDSEFRFMNNWVTQRDTNTKVETGIMPNGVNNILSWSHATGDTDYVQHINVEPNTDYTFSFNGGGTFTTYLWEKKADNSSTAVYKDNAVVYTSKPFSMTAPRSEFTQTIKTQPDTVQIQMIFRVKASATAVSARFALPKLEKAVRPSDWTPNPKDFEDLVNDLTIGSVNLVTGTSFEDTNGWVARGITGSTLTSDKAPIGLNPSTNSFILETRNSSGTQIVVPLGTVVGTANSGRTFMVKKGEKYTLSMNVACNELGGILDYMYLMYSDNVDNYKLKDIKLTDFPKVCPISNGSSYYYHAVKITFTATKDDNNAYLLIGGKATRALDGTNGYAWIRMNALKLEKGSKATDWSQSPLDVNKLISDTAKNVDINNRNLLLDSIDYQSAGWSFQSAVRTTEKYKGTTVVDCNTDWSSLDYKVSDLVGRNVVKEDDTLTYICSARLLGATTETKDLLFFLAGSDMNNKSVGKVDKDWKTFSVTFKMLKAIIDQNQIMRFEVTGISNTAMKLQVAEFRLVKGDKVVDWSPSPEEISQMIADADKKAVDVTKKVDDMSADNKLTPLEKQQAKTEWDAITVEYPQMIAQADSFGLSTSSERVAYYSAHFELKKYIEPLLANMNVTSDLGRDAFRNNFKNYFDAKAKLLKKVSDTSKGLIDNINIGSTQLIRNTIDFSKGWRDFQNIKSRKVVVDERFGNTLEMTTDDLITSRNPAISNDVIRAEVGKEYTFSMWIKRETDGVVSQLTKLVSTDNKESNPFPAGEVSIKANTWHYLTQTFTVPTGTAYMYFTPRIVTSEAGKKFWVTKPKCEVGNRATDWSPAPEDIQELITLADTKATEVTAKVNEMSADNKITPMEKRDAKNEWEQIMAEYPVIYVQGDPYTITTEKTAYKSAYDSLKAYVEPIIANLTTTSDVDSNTFRARFKTYSDAKAKLLKAVSDASKGLYDNMRIGGRNIIRKSQLTPLGHLSSSFDVATNTWTLSSANGVSNWTGVRIDDKKTVIPIGSWYTVSFEIFVPVDTTWNMDVNNSFVVGTPTGNDNDDTALRTTSNKALKGNVWNKCWFMYKNRDNSATDLYDYSNFGVVNRTGATIEVKIRNVKGELGNKPTEFTFANEDIDELITNADTKAQEAKKSIDDMSSDSKVTPIEKVQLKKEWAVITSEKPQYEALAVNFGVNAEKNNYVNSYNALNTAITPILSKMQETSDINGASFRGIFDDYYDRKAQLIRKINESSKTVAQNLNGKVLYTDPTFKDGINSVKIYNNLGNANVTMNRIAKLSDTPTSSDYVLEFKSIATPISPNYGGFNFGTMTRANAVFITKFVAKLPVGSSFVFGTNSTGTGGKSEWLTSSVGTGNWEEYIYRVQAGSTGSFSTTNFFSVLGGTLPLTWHLAYATVIDATDYDYSVADMSNDNKLTPTEKIRLKQEFESIKAEKVQYENLSNSLKITTEKTDYVNAYTGIETPLNTYLANMTTTTDIVGATFRTLFNTYYDRRAKLIKKINDVIQGNIDNVSIGGRNLLKNTGYIFTDLTEWTNYGTILARTIGNETTALSGKHLVVACKGTVTSGVHNRPVTTLTVGETYSWTVYLKAGRNCKVEVGAEMGGVRVVDVTTTWQKFTHTFKATTSAQTSFKFYYQQDGGADVNIYIHSAQLEAGDRNSATWTPAPEDFDKQLGAIATRMDNAELKITDSAIVATVTKSTEFKGKADSNTVYTKDELANMSTAQLLNNTEFTVDTSGWILANSSGSDVIALDTTKQFEGANSIKIQLGTRATDVWWGAQCDYLPARPNQDFTASVYTFTDGMTGITNDARMEIAFYDVNNVKLGLLHTTIKPTANNTWQRFSLTRTAPANTAKVRVWAYVVRSGRVWMAKPMLQYGTVMGAWTPSIGELATDYKSQISQTAGRIDIVVGSDNKIKGEAIASAISLTPSAITLISNSINLNGKVTFNSLDSSLKGNITDFNSMTGTSNGKTVINGDYIRSGTISGVNINVDTDLRVGNTIYLGQANTSVKTIYFNELARINGGHGYLNAGIHISALETKIDGGTIKLYGTLDLTNLYDIVGGIPAVFG